MQFLRSNLWRLLAITSFAAVLSACGGAGGSSSNFKGNFVDSPVKGMCYSASPSGITGTTDAAGTYEFKAGDTVSFAIPNNGSCTSGSTISLGSAVAVDPSLTVNSLTHVLGLPNGRRMAEVLNALNVGTNDNMNISNLSIPPMQVSRLTNYINNGTLPADAADNGALLQSVQAAVTPPTGTTYALPVVPATFNNDVTTHLDTTLTRVVSANTSTIKVSDAIGKLYFQAQSGGGGASIGIINSTTLMTDVSGYNNQNSNTVRNRPITMSANMLDLIDQSNSSNTSHVKIIWADAQKMMYTLKSDAGASSSGSVNFLTPINLASVAGKRMTFEGTESCNGVAMDGVYDFNASGTVMTSPLFSGYSMNVSADSGLPGTLKLTNPTTGTVIYFGMGAGGTMGAAGTTLFYVTPSLNASLQQGIQGDDMKPFGNFKIKANATLFPKCDQSVSVGTAVGTVTAASGNGIKVIRGSGSNSYTTMLTTGQPILEGDLIDTGSNTATIDFKDKSFLQLDKNIVVEIRTTVGVLDANIASAILRNGSLWGRVMTSTGVNLGGGGLVAGDRG
jgi:hypothetical protein